MAESPGSTNLWTMNPELPRQKLALVDVQHVAVLCVVALSVGLLSSACGGGLGPCPGVQEGTQLRLEVLGRSADETSSTSCPDDWGFATGATIEGEIVALKGENDCKSGVLSVDAVSGWSWELDNDATVYGGQTLESRYVISNGNCSARLWLFLFGPGGNSANCNLGSDASCELQLRLNADLDATTADCPELCSAHLDVRPQRL